MSIVGDERGVIVTWLFKIVLVLGLIGFVLFNAGAMAVNTFGLSSTATDIAVQVSSDMSSQPSMTITQAATEAQGLAHEHGAHLSKIWINQDDDTLHIELRRRADVLLIGKVKSLKPYVVARATGQSGLT